MFGKLVLALTLVIFGANAMQEEYVKQEIKDCSQVKVDETGFPSSLSYHEMDVLAGGGCLKTGHGMKIMALDPDAMGTMIPGTGKRIVRSALAVFKISNEAKAQAFGEMKNTDNYTIRTYRYEPAIGTVGGQFSVFSEVPSVSQQVRKPSAKEVELFERIKKRDLVATAELQKGKMDPVVIAHFIEEQVGALKGLLAESTKALDKNKVLIRDAVRRADMDAYDYLSLWLRKNDSQVIFLRQQIYFFEKKIDALRAELPQTEAHEWITLKGIILNINFLHQEIDQDISAFLEHNRGFMEHHPNYPKSTSIAKQAGYHNVDISPAAAPAVAGKPPSPARPPRSDIMARESPQATVETGEFAHLKQSRDYK